MLQSHVGLFSISCAEEELPSRTVTLHMDHNYARTVKSKRGAKSASVYLHNLQISTSLSLNMAGNI